MATIYNVKSIIVSDFVSYSENDIEKIIKKQIHSFVDKETGLTLRIHHINVTKD